MIVALYILIALVCVGVVLYLFHTRDQQQTSPETEEETTIQNDSDECCGMHITCEKDSLLASVSREIEYYDDEELDRFRGRTSDGYTEEETEEFRNVLLTLMPHDIAGWGRSIQLRGLELPDAVREELLMIVAEARSAAVSVI